MERIEPPAFLREAMQAAGVDVDAVAERAPDAIPDDADDRLRQAQGAPDGGLRCAECGQGTRPTVQGVLIEITGWHQPREQGGQNHVIHRVETGRIMCPSCAVRFKTLGHAGAGQEALL